MKRSTSTLLRKRIFFSQYTSIEICCPLYKRISYLGFWNGRKISCTARNIVPRNPLFTSEYLFLHASVLFGATNLCLAFIYEQHCHRGYVRYGFRVIKVFNFEIVNKVCVYFLVTIAGIFLRCKYQSYIGSEGFLNTRGLVEMYFNITLLISSSANTGSRNEDKVYMI